MSIALWRGFDLSLAGQTTTQRCSRCSPRARPGSCTSALELGGPVVAWTGRSPGAPSASARLVDLGADGRVRADQRALVALDADLRVPDRDLVRRCCASPTAPCRSARCRPPGRRDTGSRSPLPAMHQRPSRAARSPGPRRGRPAGAARVDGRLPRGRRPRRGARACGRPRRSSAARTSLALLAVGLLDRLLDLRDRLLARQDAGEREEAGLHDGVDAPPMPASRATR